MRVFISTAITLVLMAGAGAAIAQNRPDPMRAAATVHGTPSADDPMAALQGTNADAGEEGVTANEELGGLPDGPGAEDTYYQCVACHSTEIIKQQRLTDARWDDLWQWMVEEQGMIEPEPETKAVIMEYLKTHFSSER